jgi:predicted GIY-YIG superfamily endonuclease
MIGIYKYENKINGHCYIGKSIDIKRRQYNHKSSAYNEKAKDYDSQFH